MARYACDGCGERTRPRAAARDIEGPKTTAARRVASLACSSLCYAETPLLDGLNVDVTSVFDRR